LRYEGFGPDRIAVIVETLTDNKNRTASNIRTIFQKNGGSLGTQGSATHNFKQAGVIRVDKNEISEDKVFEYAIDSGAEECISKSNFHEILTEKSELYEVKKRLEKNISNFVSTRIEWISLNNVELSNEKKDLFNEMIELLEEDDDVQSIYTNKAN